MESVVRRCADPDFEPGEVRKAFDRRLRWSASASYLSRPPFETPSECAAPWRGGETDRSPPREIGWSVDAQIGINLAGDLPIHPPYVLSSAQDPLRIMATLRELRERNALSQRDLARLAGVAGNTVLDVEKRRRRPRPSTRRKLAKALDVLPRDIDF